jgi:hypothetical protein
LEGIVGLLLVNFSAICFGTNPIFASLSYRREQNKSTNPFRTTRTNQQFIHSNDGSSLNTSIIRIILEQATLLLHPKVLLNRKWRNLRAISEGISGRSNAGSNMGAAHTGKPTDSNCKSFYLGNPLHPILQKP